MEKETTVAAKKATKRRAPVKKNTPEVAEGPKIDNSLNEIEFNITSKALSSLVAQDPSNLPLWKTSLNILAKIKNL